MISSDLANFAEAKLRLGLEGIFINKDKKMENLYENNLIAEGKTKRIYQTEIPEYVVIESKDDLTAGDGAKHDIIKGKAVFSNTTTSNVFRLLKKCDIPVAFIEKISETKFISEKCTMIPYEVVIRREAHGSFLKRRPELKRGHLFPRLIIEFFLKTSNKKWQDVDLLKDDPLIIFQDNSAHLYLPDQPIYQQNPFAMLESFPLKESPKVFEEINEIATQVFLVLEKQWQLIDKKLVDLKMEFGINAVGTLKLADVIDNDSWRLLENGKYIDKQIYRDGANLETVSLMYQLVTTLTGNFKLPQQQIILWRASKSDDINLFQETIDLYKAQEICEVKIITCSIHKEPMRGLQEIIKLVQEIPDSVILTFVGRSNGLGPTLSAQVTVPVITIPANYKDFPEDIWSSLRTPSDTPVMTVLDPKNATIAALQILAMRNPRLYAKLRSKQENHFYNIVKV